MQKKDSNEKTYKPCSSCGTSKTLDQFYVSTNPIDSHRRVSICKKCVIDNVDVNRIESVKDMLLQLNKPFLQHQWDSSVTEGQNRNKNPWGMYIKSIYLNYRDLTWKDSEDTVYQNKNNKDHLIPSTSPTTDDTQRKLNVSYDLSQLKSKYGYGYPDDEYYLFEDKYQQLKTSFQLLTTMHEEYFREFCVNKVKETLAKAKGNFKEAKEWAAMVKDVAEAGKLKPSQMSKADLSGGLDTFGQLARMVEENYEIMPLLPHFTEQPKDKVDVTLWCFINYVRDLKGLPECEYKEIYAFYDKKKQDYESQMSDSSFGNEEDDVNG